MGGFLGYCDEALVSTDFETCPISSTWPRSTVHRLYDEAHPICTVHSLLELFVVSLLAAAAEPGHAEPTPSSSSDVRRKSIQATSQTCCSGDFEPPLATFAVQGSSRE